MATRWRSNSRLAGFELSLEKIDRAEVDRVVAGGRVEDLGLCQRRNGVVVTLFGDCQTGAVEPALAQCRVERQRLVEVLAAVVELAADAVCRGTQEERAGVLRLALEDRSEQDEGAVAVTGVHRLLRSGERIGGDRNRACGQAGGLEVRRHPEESGQEEGSRSAKIHAHNLSDRARAANARRD